MRAIDNGLWRTSAGICASLSSPLWVALLSRLPWRPLGVQTAEASVRGAASAGEHGTSDRHAARPAPPETQASPNVSLELERAEALTDVCTEPLHRRTGWRPHVGTRSDPRTTKQPPNPKWISGAGAAYMCGSGYCSGLANRFGFWRV